MSNHDEGFGSGGHPFTAPAGTDVSMFIQWKGTDLCVDFICPCGVQSHFDGFFAYALRCPGCKSIFVMGTQVIAKRVDSFDGCIEDLECVERPR